MLKTNACQMHKIYAFLFFFFLGLSVAHAQVDTAIFKDMKNIVLLDDDIVAGGPPSEADIGAAKKHGFKTIIDLRLPDKIDSERDMALKAGLQYVNIPVTPETLSLSQVNMAAQIMDDAENRPLILHCSSGSRAAAIWALYLKKFQGLKAEAAYEQGVMKGLKKEKMQQATKNLLEKDINE